MEGITQHQASFAKQNYPESKSKLWSEIKLKRILGEKILKYIENGRLSDAFALYNLFKEKEKLE